MSIPFRKKIKRSVTFSDRQIEVIKLWAETDSTAEAANKLGISEHTFLSHLKRLRKKVGVNRTFHVFYHMQQNGVFEGDKNRLGLNFMGSNGSSSKQATTSIKT